MYTLIFLILVLSEHQRELLKTIHWSSETIGRFIDESGQGSSYPSRRSAFIQASNQGDAAFSEKIELEVLRDSSVFGESNLIKIKHAGKEAVRKRNSTKSSHEPTSPSSSQEQPVAEFPSNSQIKSLELPSKPILDTTSGVHLMRRELLLAPKEPRVSRSLSENPKSKNRSLSTATPHSVHARRLSAGDERPFRRLTQDDTEDNKPNWFYEDVPDPDAEDWGKLDGILSVLNPEPPNQKDDHAIQEEIPAALEAEIKGKSPIINAPSSSLPITFVPKDSQQELLNTEDSSGMGYVDFELESIESVGSSLPADPQYFGPVFRSIPTWIPIRTIYIALFLFLVTTVLNVMIVVSSINQWNTMPQCSTKDKSI